MSIFVSMHSLLFYMSISSSISICVPAFVSSTCIHVAYLCLYLTLSRSPFFTSVSLSVCLSAYMHVCIVLSLRMYVYVCLAVIVLVSLFLSLCIYLPVFLCLTLCLCVGSMCVLLSVSLSLPVCLSLAFSLCLSVCLFVSLSPCNLYYNICFTVFQCLVLVVEEDFIFHDL